MRHLIGKLNGKSTIVPPTGIGQMRLSDRKRVDNNLMPSLRPRRLLFPLVPAYRLALWLRAKQLGTRKEPVRRLRFPVVSIGNLSTGGAGKTPLTIALAQALKRRGFAVDGLSRGYSRR